MPRPIMSQESPMNARTRKLYQSLRQTIAVIDAYPEFRAYAAESKAVTLFINEVNDLEALHIEQESSRRELKELASRKRELMDNINITIAGLAATTALLPASIAP